MGKKVLVSFNRSPKVVVQRSDTVTLEAGNSNQHLAIETSETQLGTTVEVSTDPESPVMKAYREGAALSISYGDDTITIPSRSSDTEIGEFFGVYNA